MIVGIDGNEANIENRVGVNKYAFEIIWGIQKLLPENPDLIVLVYLRSKPLSDMPSETSRFKYKILPNGKLWILTKLMPSLYFGKERPEIFFSPNHYIPPFAPMPRVCAIMDLGYLKFSEHFTKYDYWQLKLWSAWSMKVSKYIISISNASKEDIVREYMVPDRRVIVTHLGADDGLTQLKISDTSIERVKKKYSIVSKASTSKSNYILYLGTLKPGKNVLGLIRAFAGIDDKQSLSLRDKKLHLVIAGKKGWLYESVFEEVKKLGLTDRVIFTDFVDEKDKYPLIKGAKIFVLPSFWEGFGIDILSAFALSVPVVASNVGSLPEVVGNAGVLVDPKSADSITDGIVKILSMNKTEHGKLIAKGKAQLAKFSWEKAVKLTLITLRKATND